MNIRLEHPSGYPNPSQTTFSPPNPVDLNAQFEQNPRFLTSNYTFDASLSPHNHCQQAGYDNLPRGMIPDYYASTLTTLLNQHPRVYNRAPSAAHTSAAQYQHTVDAPSQIPQPNRVPRLPQISSSATLAHASHSTMPPTGSAPPPPSSTLSFEQRSAPSPRTSTRGSLPHVPPPPSLAPPTQPSATQSASLGTLFSFKYYNPEKSRRAGWRTAKYDDEDELPPSLPSPHVQPPSVPQHNPPTQPSATQSTSLSTVSSFWYYNSEESSRTASRSDPHDSNVALSQPPPPPLSVPQQKNTKRASTRKRTAKTKKTNPSGPEPLMQADSSPAMAELTQSQTQTKRLEPIPTPRFPVPAPVQTTQKRRRDDSDDEAGFSSSKRERVEEQSEDTTGFSVSGGDEELSAIVGLVPDTLDFIDSSASSPTVTTTPTETSAVVPVPVHEEVEPDLSASRVATPEPLESGVVSPKQTFEHSPPEIAAATAQDQEEGFLNSGSGSGSPADVADSNYNSKPAHDDHEFDWKAYWMPDLNAPTTRIEHDIAPDPTGESTNESDEWALPVSLTLLFNV